MHVSVVKGLNFLHVDKQDSDQTGQIPKNLMMQRFAKKWLRVSFEHTAWKTLYNDNFRVHSPPLFQFRP